MEEEDQKPDLTPLSSPVNDVRKLRANSAAAADELMGWLAQMRGKSPKEVLGEVANSSLFKSLVQSALLLGFIIVAWTAAVWGYDNFVRNSAATDLSPPAEVAAGDQDAAAETKAPTPEPTPEIADPAKAEMPELSADDKQVAADTLGVSDVKEAPANLNPLDSADDDILKDLE